MVYSDFKGSVQLRRTLRRALTQLGWVSTLTTLDLSTLSSFCVTLRKHCVSSGTSSRVKFGKMAQSLNIYKYLSADPVQSSVGLDCLQTVCKRH